MSGLCVSASGILNAIQRNDITANNVANSRTTGFRAQRADNVEAPGGGVRIGSTTRSDEPGSFQVTNRELDLAASEGFFRVQTAGGQAAFTRDGSFGLNADGQVVTSDGALLNPPITVPGNATSVTVSRDGQVFAQVPGELQPQQVGQIDVFTFANPGGLEAIGGNLFAPTANSGGAQNARQGAGIVQGVLEGSNVSLVREITDQIVNTNAARANADVFRTQSDTLGELLNITG